MTQAISILGSTGSIGRQTLEVCAELGIQVAALTAHSNVDLLERQVRQFQPCLAVLYEMEPALELTRRLSDLDVKVAYGLPGVIEAAALPESDTVVTAVVGMAGLQPTLAAIRQGQRVALANKETLVCAGGLVMESARQYGAEIVPVDSEHSAIFQCLQGCRDRTEIRKLILTCSGGPFFGMSREELAHKTKADALRHPNWTMGEKITIDCATLMNKGLEYIEAMRLFAVEPAQLDVVIHRQSIIHSMVEFRDGALLAQLGTPDMRLPIRYAMTYPQRAESAAEPLNLLSCPPLTFEEPDRGTFPCLRLAEVAAAKGGTACAVLNAANEEAVRLFLEDRIGFRDIFDLTARAMTELPVVHKPSLPDILEADAAARREVLKNVSR